MVKIIRSYGNPNSDVNMYGKNLGMSYMRGARRMPLLRIPLYMGLVAVSPSG